jgi:hypothetical protein
MRNALVAVVLVSVTLGARVSAGQSAPQPQPSPSGTVITPEQQSREAQRRHLEERLAEAQARLNEAVLLANLRANLGITADHAENDGAAVKVRGHVTITIGDKVITTEEATIK